MNNTQKLSKKCLICGDIFYREHRQSYQFKIQKYCSRKCSITQTKISKQDQSNHPRNKEGYKPWNEGKKMSKKQKEKMNLSGLEIGRGFNKGKKLPQMSGINNPNYKPKTSKICEYCSKEILLPPWRVRTQRYFCNRVCWALGTRGKGSPVFKGEDAVAPLRKRIMELPEHDEWHTTILMRDNYKCVLCTSRVKLEVDHIKRFLHIVQDNNIKNIEDARNCKELWDINNGRTLCKECHRKTDTYGTKGTRKHY